MKKLKVSSKAKFKPNFEKNLRKLYGSYISFLHKKAYYIEKSKEFSERLYTEQLSLKEVLLRTYINQRIFLHWAVCAYVRAYVHACVCVWERERDGFILIQLMHYIQFCILIQLFQFRYLFFSDILHTNVLMSLDMYLFMMMLQMFKVINKRFIEIILHFLIALVSLIWIRGLHFVFQFSSFEVS